MIFLSAGHNKQGAHPDPGAVFGKWIEADLTKELRDLIAEELRFKYATFTLDDDFETLSDYIKRIKPGSGSVVCEVHFNCSTSLATGIEVIVKDNPSLIERKLAADICNIGASLGIYNRSVKTEVQSHRGHLGILHTKAGISVLPEICFINNPSDMSIYQKNKGVFAMKIAALLKRYDDLNT